MFTSVPQKQDIVNVTFSNCRFYDALVNNISVSMPAIKMFAHGCTMDVEVIPSIELKRIFSENDCWHFSQVHVWGANGRVVAVKIIVCFKMNKSVKVNAFPHTSHFQYFSFTTLRTPHSLFSIQPASFRSFNEIESVDRTCIKIAYSSSTPTAPANISTKL